MLLRYRCWSAGIPGGTRTAPAAVLRAVPTRFSMSGRKAIKRVSLFHSFPSQESLLSPIDRRSAYYRAARRAEAEAGEGEGDPSAAAHPEPQPLLTPPNVLTLLRVVLVPVFVVAWYSQGHWMPAITAVVFVGAALTDALDGYLARKLDMSTEFGAFLDPVADKLMVTTALILLATAPPGPLPSAAMAVPVLFIIGREIAMSSLREWAAKAGGNASKAVKVNSLGKWKTALQMVGISALLALRESSRILGASRLELINSLTWGALALLYGGAVLAVWSLIAYLGGVWVHFRYPDGHPIHNPVDPKK
mmetsp:Transcript_7472/g.22112  ORF Transcript_7472/g.22112 Transcript_7472/m.22112 type:complete len:306 (+) Transcript_7472:187-1104(+)